MNGFQIGDRVVCQRALGTVIAIGKHSVRVLLDEQPIHAFGKECDPRDLTKLSRPDRAGKFS